MKESGNLGARGLRTRKNTARENAYEREWECGNMWSEDVDRCVCQWWNARAVSGVEEA